MVQSVTTAVAILRSAVSVPFFGVCHVSQDLVEHRKKSWELYGYDFMVDDQYRPWLIEINSSPACDYSTKVVHGFEFN